MTKRRLSLASTVIASVINATAQDCREVAAMAQMLRAKSYQTLSTASQQAGESYLAQLVYAYRSFELRPRSKEVAERELAQAVLLSPGFLPQYVRYSIVAVLDPHSDYAVRMRPVCQKAHPDFIRAVKLLPEDNREAFAKHILNPSSCKVLASTEKGK
jgi:hypothetical protein